MPSSTMQLRSANNKASIFYGVRSGVYMKSGGMYVFILAARMRIARYNVYIAATSHSSIVAHNA